MVWVDAHDSCNLLVFGSGCFVETLDEEGTGMNVPFSITDVSKEKQKYVDIYGGHVDIRLSSTSVLL